LSHGPKWDFAASKSLFSQWPIIDSNGIKRLSERQIAIAPLSLIAVQLLGNPIAVNPSSDASPSISVGNRCRRNSHSRCFARQHRASACLQSYRRLAGPEVHDAFVKQTTKLIIRSAILPPDNLPWSANAFLAYSLMMSFPRFSPE
jgi:hypothetical protein